MHKGNLFAAKKKILNNTHRIHSANGRHSALVYLAFQLLKHNRTKFVLINIEINTLTFGYGIFYGSRQANAMQTDGKNG